MSLKQDKVEGLIDLKNDSIEVDVQKFKLLPQKLRWKIWSEVRKLGAHLD